MDIHRNRCRCRWVLHRCDLHRVHHEGLRAPPEADEGPEEPSEVSPEVGSDERELHQEE